MPRTHKEPEVISPDDPLGVQVEDMPKAALAVMPSQPLAIQRNPQEVLNEAREAAKVLIEMVKAKPKPFMLHGDIYLQFEDWQTVGRFYGATVKVTETKFIELGTVKGFEARAVVLDKNGLEVSGAEAMCLDDEKNWKSKPLFQLKSMAQTRASAKALRNVFAWVVVLAGYKPTPAEEMDGVRPSKAQESVSLELVEGVIEKPQMNSGNLWFYIGNDIFNIPPMQGQDMKSLLEQADKAFVEMKVTPIQQTKGGKQYRTVKEIVKFEPEVPF